jgi:hypothetical protein
MEPTAKSYEAARRGTRIRAQLPVRVTSLDPSSEFTERCQTLVVNPQGCGVRLSRPLNPGLQVDLDELPTGQTVAAMVVNCVPLGTGGKFWLVGLALEQTGNVWGIHPAPADWGVEPVAMAAAATAAPVPAKKNEWPYSQFSSKGEFHPGRR